MQVAGSWFQDFIFVCLLTFNYTGSNFLRMLESVSAWLASPTIGGIPLNAALINLAIRSCWNSSRSNSDKAARYFYDLFGELGLAPTGVTFGTLVGAFKFSPLEDVLWTFKEMKAQKIAPNRVFAETFLFSVLGTSELTRTRKVEVFARENLRTKPRERLQAAREALNDFESQGVELSGVCRQVKRALRHVGF